MLRSNFFQRILKRLCILQRKETTLGCAYLLFGKIPIFTTYSPIKQIVSEFNIHKSPMNAQSFDCQIEKITNKLPVKKSCVGTSTVILATEVYDMGGHTKCIKYIIAASDKKIPLFLMRLNNSEQHAPIEMKWFYSKTSVTGLDCNSTKGLKESFHAIVSARPRAVVALIHMDDIWGAALLSLLKRAGIKILFFNHGSHYSAVGMKFADVILETTRATAKITATQRGYKNIEIIGLPHLPKEDLPFISVEQVKSKRSEIGVPENAILTVSGATSYKFFDDGASPYLEMIARLLLRNEKMYHIIISDLNTEEKAIFDSIFHEHPARNRVKILKTDPAYKLLFKCADVFIDSFPVSSALTHIDVISLGVPNVIKKNCEKPEFDFSENMPADYPFAFAEIADMEVGIESLLHSSAVRQNVAKQNYAFFLENYEGKKWIKKLNSIVCRSS